jgi:urease accessory protein
MLRKLAAIVALLPLTAHAHHFMGGGVPETVTQGLLSGLGHPIIGADHAAFILVAGFLLALVDKGLWALGALIAGSLVGAAMHLSGLAFPRIEEAIALSVVLAGALLVWRRRVPLVWMSAGLGLAGVLHGYAYAETIFGAESGPLGAYLIGFSVIQFALAFAAYRAHRWLMARHTVGLATCFGGAAGILGAAFLALQLAA